MKEEAGRGEQIGASWSRDHDAYSCCFRVCRAIFNSNQKPAALEPSPEQPGRRNICSISPNPWLLLEKSQTADALQAVALATKESRRKLTHMMLAVDAANVESHRQQMLMMHAVALATM